MKPEDILADGAETYAEKNEDYGDSWRTVGEILHMLAGGEAVELETPEDFTSFGLFTRRLDKMARAFNGEFRSGELNFESVFDAHEDESVYAAMHASNQAERGAETENDSAIEQERAISKIGIDHPTAQVE